MERNSSKVSGGRGPGELCEVVRSRRNSTGIGAQAYRGVAGGDLGEGSSWMRSMPSAACLGSGSGGDKGERSFIDTRAPGDLMEEGVVLLMLL
jgi:hypothetical protein